MPTYSGYSLGIYTGDMNHARAGGSAIGQDATTATLNPGAMTRLVKAQWVVSTRYYSPSVKFTNKGSIDAIGQPLIGGNGGDGGVAVLAPGLYYARPMRNDWWLGAGINAPFGLATEYNRDWVGRYQSVESSITTLAVNLSLARKLDAQWSVGGGIFYQQAEAKLSNAIDFGSVCLASLPAANCSALGMPAPQSADGFIQLDGDGAGFGGTLGVLWEIDRYRIGASYRSEVEHELEADADYTNPAGVAAFAPLFTDTTATVVLTLPERISLSAYMQLSASIGLMADVTRTSWSNVDVLNIDYANSAQATTTFQKQWDDSTRYSIGIDYVATDRLTIQAGVAREESPIPANTFEPGVPIAGLTWVAAGVVYQMTDALTLDAGISRVMVDDQDIRITGATGETLIGNISSDMMIYGVRLSGSL